MVNESWREALSRVIDASDFENKDVFDEYVARVSSIADDTIDILSDGFQWGDLVRFFKVIGPIMDIAEEVTKFAGSDKEQFVVDMMWAIYQAVDTYPDGEGNRINIPVLFGSMERKFEKKMVDLAARASIKAVHGYGKSLGKF